MGESRGHWENGNTLVCTGPGVSSNPTGATSLIDIVASNSPLVEECRRGVLEFLLINHPLDCPICDQAGECPLQEFSVEYGRQDSRFLEHKVKKPKNVELGPRVLGFSVVGLG